MRRRFATLRRTAAAIEEKVLAAGALQEAGRRRSASCLRWEAARRALIAEIATRQTYGLPWDEQTKRLGAIRAEDYLQ
jgi:hypothetical protein